MPARVSAAERVWIAYHEAGHVVAATRDGIGIRRVTLEPHGRFAAYTDYAAQPVVRISAVMPEAEQVREATRVHNCMVVSLAGVHAGYRAAGRAIPSLSERLATRATTPLDDWADHVEALKMAAGVGLDAGADGLQYADADAAELIASPVGWTAITRVAEALLVQGTLGAAELADLLADQTTALALVGTPAAE